jgi:hypothetical protein
VFAPLSRGEMLNCLLRWAGRAEDAHFHTAALPATERDALDALQLAADLAGLRLDARVAWPGTRDAPAETPLTRLAYAKAAVALLETANPGRQAAEAHWMPALDDAQDRAARLACGLGLMQYVTLETDGAARFDPDRVMSLAALREHALWFALAVNAEQADRSAPDGDDAPTIGEAAKRVYRLLSAFADHPRLAEPPILLDNGAAWPWYFAQEDTGEFSANNCMPAAAAMALRWLNPDSDATPEGLRALYPLNGGPWYPEQVSAVFDRYGVGYALRSIDLQRMLRCLENGHILIALLNEGTSGHCVVIKGTIREGDGLWFLTYDPASPTRDALGRPAGQDRRIEATQLIAAMECHWWLFFDISRDALDLD